MKVAIVGGAPSTEFMAPYGDNSWEIWVLGNRADRHLDKRVSRIFEVHDNLSEHGDVQKYAEWLVSHRLPVITGEKFPIKAEHVKAYPYEAVEALYGSLYLTSSPAYMLALAILYEASTVAIYGVDLSISDHEYFWQRPCMEAWIGFAKGRGIEVIIPEESHIGKSSYVEGRDWGNDVEVGVFSEENFLAMAAEHSIAQEKIQAERRELALKAAAHDGAQQVYSNLAKTSRAVEAKIDVKSLKQTTRLR